MFKLNGQLLINFPMVLIPLSAPGLMFLLLLVMSASPFSGWGYHALPGSLWGYCVGIFHSGAAALKPYNLWSTPQPSKDPP